MAREVQATGGAGATSAAGNTGDCNGAICDYDDNDAIVTDVDAAAGGDVAVIAIGDRKPSQ